MEELLKKPYWVIDFLPEQVSPQSAGQVFAVERFYLQEPQQSALRRRFADILLKVNCYYDFQICEPEDEAWQPHPTPEQLFSWITENKKDACILLPDENTLFTVNRDDVCMTIFNPPDRLLQLLDRLSIAEGLFLWQP